MHWRLHHGRHVRRAHQICLLLAEHLLLHVLLKKHQSKLWVPLLLLEHLLKHLVLIREPCHLPVELSRLRHLKIVLSELLALREQGWRGVARVILELRAFSCQVRLSHRLLHAFELLGCRWPHIGKSEG